MQFLQPQDQYTGFKTWLKKRKGFESKHVIGNGINDYAYGMDLELRSKLDKIPGFYKNARRMVETLSAQEMANLDRYAIQVTPDLHGDIYRLAADCAKMLGIAMPYVYIRDYMLSYDAAGNPVPDKSMNAYTIGTDDHQQVIMITSSMVRYASASELKTIIGHECGHIHNRHVTYTILFRYLQSVAGFALPGFMTTGIQMTMAAWSRAAEITADRAGLLCADRVEDALNIQTKLLNGGLESSTGFSTEAVERQLERQNASFFRFSELTADHPYSTRRVMAIKAFSESELFADWRPDLVKPGEPLRPHKEVEQKCQEILDIMRI